MTGAAASPGAAQPGSTAPATGAPFEIASAILDSVGDGIVALDERHRLIYFNSAAERILHLDLQRADPGIWTSTNGVYQVDGRTPLPPEANPLIRALFGESTSNTELYIRHSNVPAGAFLRVTSRPILDSQGVPRGAVATFRDVTELRAVRIAAEQLAALDPLTNIANRRALDQRTAQLVAEGNRGRKVALALIDLDRFKEVNDLYGHQVGDEVLQAIADQLCATVRQTDYVARFGGDEFCVLLTDVDDDAAEQVGWKLQLAVQSAHDRVLVTASVGIAVYRRGALDTADALLRAADAALYYAKATGRAHVVMHSDAQLPDAVFAGPVHGR
jgi:diguanylate cyclase (GGDEF)-like protein